MAKFNGASLRYDNSDNENRVYDLKAEVVVTDGKAESVQNIEIVKDGMSIGYGNIYGLGDNIQPNANFSFSSIPMSEYKDVFSATLDFAAGLVMKAESDGSTE